MYNARYFSNATGREFFFGLEHGSVFDINDLTQIPVTLAKSQGFNQIGDTVENSSVAGRTITIKGRLLGDATAVKGAMLRAFAPLTSGRLYFEDKFFIDCSVLKSPLIGVRKEDPDFMLQLYAPYPFWRRVQSGSFPVSGKYAASFHFPVNYSKPHTFGIENKNRFTDCKNSGEAAAFYKVTFRTRTRSVNPQLINVNTLEFLKVYAEIEYGEEIAVYREGNLLKIEKYSGETVEDIFGSLDEDSNLFLMRVGSNIIKASAEEGDDQLITTIEFNEAMAGVYEGL